MVDRKFDVGIIIGAENKATKTIKKVVLGLTALGAATATMVWRAAKLESQMADVNTMLDEQTEQFLPNLQEGILDLAAAYGQSTETLSKGLYNVLSASVDVADSMDVLEASVIAASAGLTDTGMSAQAIVTIMNSYRLEASKAADISDLLFSIVKRGQTTFAQLAPAIGTVASTASVSGLSLEEMGAALSTMTRAGIDTNMAVTSLNSLLKGFVKPTKDAIEAAALLDIELNSTTLRTEGLIPVLKKLSNATTEQQAVIFGNIRAFKGLAAILQQQEGFTEDVLLMQNRGGRTMEAFAKQSDTLAFKLKQLGQKVLVMLAEKGEAFLPVIKKMVDRVGELLDYLDYWIESSGLVEEATSFLQEILEWVVETIDEMNLSIETLILFYEDMTEKVQVASETTSVAWDMIKGAVKTATNFMTKDVVKYTMVYQTEAKKRIAENKKEMEEHVKERANFLKIETQTTKALEKNKEALTQHNRLMNEKLLKQEMDSRDKKIAMSTSLFSLQIKNQEAWAKRSKAIEADLIAGTQGAFVTLFNDLGKGWKSLSDFMTNLGKVLRDTLIKHIAQVAAEWVVKHAVMTAATWAWSLAEKAATLVVFLANLAVAAVKTIAGWASVPFVGWAIGLAAAAAMVAAANSQFKFFAKGVENFGGGMAVVGEEGPELVKLPGGSTVLSNDDSRALAGGGVNLVFNFSGNEIMGDEAMDSFADRVSENILEKVQQETNIL